MSKLVPKLRFKADDGSEFPEWEKTRLCTLMSFKNGITASREQFGKGIKCISVLDILNNPYIVYDCIKSSVEVDDELIRNFSVEYGDFVFQRSSENVEDAGRANVYLDNTKKAIFSGFVIRGKKISNYEPLFINELLRTFFVRKQIMHKAQGAQHINIGQEILNSVIICLPSIPEQKKIASFLSTIDDIITATQSELTAWEERKKGVVQKIFNREVRFKADDGSEFPEWEEKRLGEVFVERSERSTDNLDLLSVTIANGVIRQNESDKRNVSSVDKSNYKRVYVGDLAYNSMRMWQGAEGVSAYDGIVSPAYTVLVPKKQEYAYFYEYMFKRTEMLHIFQRYSQGLTSDTWNLKYPVLAHISVVVPSFPEQKKIADCLSSLDDVINQINAELSAWKEFKKGLLQQMFV